MLPPGVGVCVAVRWTALLLARFHSFVHVQCTQRPHRGKRAARSCTLSHSVQRIGFQSRDGETDAPLTPRDQQSSLAIVTVQPDEVRRFGASAAIVLAALRDQGCSPTIPVLVKWAPLGRACGLHRKTTSRAVEALRRAGAVRVEPFRAAGSLLVRLGHSAAEWSSEAAPGRQEVTRRARDGLARLDTLRSLLEAVG